MDNQWEEYNHLILDDFIRSHTSHFIGRIQVLDALQRFALARDTKDEKKALCLTGEAGSGKSAVFANLCCSLSKENVLLIIHVAGNGQRSHDIHYILERWIEELCQFLKVKNGLSETYDPGELYKYFHSLLYEAGRKNRVVVLMDALDQLESTKRGMYMHWLPYRWPKNTRFICTSQPSVQTRILFQKIYSVELPLPQLTSAEIRNIASDISSKHHHAPNTVELQLLLKKRRNDGKLAAGNPLWLRMAMEEINMTGFGREPESEIPSIPATAEALFLSICQRAVNAFGEQYTQTILTLLTLGHSGWSEDDMEIIVPQITLEPWSRLTFLAFIHHFRGCLVKLKHSGLYRFSHVELVNNIATTYLKQKRTASKLQSLAADRLIRLPAENPRRCDIMVHLLESSLHKAMGDYYGSALSKLEYNAATHALAEFIGNMPYQDVREKIAGIMKLPLHDHPNITMLLEHLMFDLAENLESLISLREKEHYHLALVDLVEEMVYLHPHKIGWLRGLAIAFEKLGNVYVAHKLHDKAQTAFEASIDMVGLLADRVKDRNQWQTDLAISLEKLGDIYKVQWHLTEAVEIYKILARLAKKKSRPDSYYSFWQNTLYDSLNKTGDCYMLMNIKTEAHDHYKAALKNAARMAAEYPASNLWVVKLSASWERQGEMCYDEGLTKEAVEAYEASLEIIKPLTMKLPVDAGILRDVSSTYEKLGKIYIGQESQRKAKRAFKASMEIKKRLTDMGVIKPFSVI